MKPFILATAIAFASVTGLAHASTGSNTQISSQRDPYTSGAKASKFDVYASAAKITDPRDPYTDGAHD